MSPLQSTINQLKTLREQLTDRVATIEADVHHKKEPVEKDFAEQVTQRDNDEVLSAIDEEAQQTIYQIDAALGRIRDGKYGICVVCGEEISDKRLTALPYITTCINCAE